MSEPTTLCEQFERSATGRPRSIALRTPGDAVRITWGDYRGSAHRLAAGLAGLGVRRGETVAIMLANRPECHLVDVAALLLGAVPFSVYNTLASEQLAFVLRHSRTRVLVTERAFAEAVARVRDDVPGLDHVFVVDEGGLEAIEAAAAADFDIERSWRAVQPQDVATLIYTSGTTGAPKGVELTHANVLAQLDMWMSVMRMPEGSQLMSYLPMAHLTDRLAGHYSAIATAGTVTCVAETRLALEALPDARPTLWVGVPRLWEKVHAQLASSFAAEPDRDRREALKRAVEQHLVRVRHELAGETVPAELRASCEESDRLLFAPLRERLGFDHARYLLSGAAPIATEVLEFLAAVGLWICEAWGMTETTAAATMNRRDAIRIGTCGPPLPDVEVATAEDGELLVRGPIVMRGYREDPALTAEAIDAEGWMHTGDIGTIDADGYVTIIDRKKEIIVNAMGKNMAPSSIEQTIKGESFLIGSIIAIGDRKPYVTALITLEPAAAQALIGDEEIPLAELADHPVVRAEISAAVKRGNARLARVEQIKRWTVLPFSWLPASDELTPTLKLKRRAIHAKYASAIDAMYVA